MTVAVNDLVDRAEEEYGDTANDRISAATWIKFLNAASKDIAKRTVALGVRPAYSKTTNVVTVAGFLQSLPSDGLKVMDIHRNMGRTWVTGTAYKIDDAVFNSSTRYVALTNHTAGNFTTDLGNNKWVASPLEAGPAIQQINYHNLINTVGDFWSLDADDLSEIRFWIPVDNDRTQWYCYPPQPNTAHLMYVEMTYAALPANASAGGNIVLRDEYEEAILLYMLYRGHSIDDDIIESSVNPRSRQYFQAYLTDPAFLL